MRAIAANPIPYWAKDGKTREVFEAAFEDFRRIGFSAVKADVLDGQSAAEYRAWIGGYGLAPSVSLFNFAGLPGELEKARRFAAVQTELGLDRTMISSMSLPERMERPAVGAGFEEGRLSRAIDHAGELCRVLRAEGLWPLHHSHVGGMFETGHEITRLLDDLGSDLIGVGADTGHLTWAGVDPAAFVARYADRLGGLHLKDVFPDHLPAHGELTYGAVSDTKRLWAEPGLGVVDFDAVLAAVPASYDGDFMIEVDVPSVATRYESHRISYEWAVEHL
jgi:inosose dehydratase